MASSRSSIVELNDKDVSADLQFHDFSHEDVATLKPSETFTNYPESPKFNEETEELLKDDEKASSVWKFSYYQSFFNIDTDQVLERILWSMIPLPGRATFLDRHIRPNPDLYGPFWISTTLIFSTAISANIANYFMTAGEDNKIWHYDFHKVSLAATAIYSYAFLLPVILWGLMWYRRSSVKYSLLEILSVYGYSLFIYIPISVLWVVQVSWFQWLLVLIGAALSGLVLIQTFLPVLKEENKKIAAIVLCLMLLFHTLLAVGFVAYFFRPSHADGKIAPLLPPSSPATKVSAATIAQQSASKVHRDITVQQNNKTARNHGKIGIDDQNKLINGNNIAPEGHSVMTMISPK